MRPRYLEIEGLQSFREAQRIDFDRLGEVGLFGIFGPTGSGKSTILDAMTLALYGTVQRALRGTQGIINSEMGSMRVSFTFDLVKEDMDTLSGKIRRTFRVERVYRRKKDTENAAEAKISRLFEVTPAGEVILADKQGEVNSSIVELIGLQFEDFTRTVVLPQNKFQDFLLAPKAEKTKMMEKIFYLEEYGRLLWDRVSRKLGEVRNILAGIEGGIAALGDVTGFSMAEMDIRLEETRLEKEQVTSALTAVEQNYNKAREVWGILAEQRELESAMQAHGDGAVKVEAWRRKVKKAEEANEILDFLKQYKAVSAELEAVTLKSENCSKQVAAALSALLQAQEKHEAHGRQMQHELPQMIEYRARLADGLKLNTEIEEMETKLQGLRELFSQAKKNWESSSKKTTELRERMESLSKDTEEMSVKLEQLRVDPVHRKALLATLKQEEDKDRAEMDCLAAKKKAQEIETALAGLEADLAAVRKETNQLQLELAGFVEKKNVHDGSKPCEEVELAQFEGKLQYYRSIMDSCIQTFEDLNKVQIEAEAREKEIVELESVLEESRRKAESLAQQKAAVMQEIEGCSETIEKNTAARLSIHLMEGLPCPVCGSTHHPEPAAISETSDLQQLQQLLKVHQDKLGTINNELTTEEMRRIKLQEMHKNLLVQKAQSEKEIVRLSESAEMQKMKLPKQLQCAQTSIMEQELERMLADNSQKKEQLLKWEQEGVLLQTQLLESEKNLNQKRVIEERRLTELQIKQEEFGQAQNMVRTSTALFEEVKSRCMQQSAILGISNIRQALEQIEKNDHLSEKLQNDLKQKNTELDQVRKQYELEADEGRRQEDQMKDISNEGKTLKIQADNARAKLSGLLGSKDINAEIQENEKKITAMKDMDQQLLNLLETVRKSHQESSHEMSALQKQKEIFEENFQNEEKRLKGMLAEKGFESIQKAEEVLLEEKEYTQIKADIESYDENGRKLQAQKQILASRLAGRTLDPAEWESICSRYETLKAEKEACIAKFEQIKAIYESRKSNYERWIVLEQQQRFFNRKKENLELIQKLLKGNGFIEFISEERLRYIAREATETLGILTKYRYALELDNESGFVIVDNMNGGMRRMVASLSGGEIFLTSLSLALALSSQLQLKGQSPLEFFFLDEGFGTLDNELLDTVIDALERLSTTQRIIGIISHVPELRNRIQRRLVVEPPTASGKGSTVMIERA